MKKYIVIATLGILGSFILATPVFAADEGIISSFFQNKLNASSERRENIRERLGVEARTPLSVDALAIIDQVIQKFTTASIYLAESAQYTTLLEDTYTPDTKIAARVTFADNEDRLQDTINRMVAYRKDASKETISDFEAQVAVAKTLISDMGSVSLARIESLRAAQIPAHLLSFGACSFVANKSALYMAVDDANLLTFQFTQKDPSICPTAWKSVGTNFGTITIQEIGNAHTVAKTSITQNADGISAKVTLGKDVIQEDLVAVISDSATTEANTFVIPLRTHK